jgi:predicted RNA-binding protein YlxR (DUF448 family)
VTPIRSCVGCGDRAPQVTLLRVTYRDGSLRRDGAPRAAGRGAYLHERPACWDAFAARRGPVRSLRSAVPHAVRVRLVEELRAHAARREG